MLSQADTKTRPAGRTRDPEGTRAHLIECAFQEIYEHGYAGASLDRILAKTGVTKGALYHHFGSKADLLHAVLDEAVRPLAVARFIEPLRDTDDPIAAVADSTREVLTNVSDEQFECGCPLNNLTQELARTDEAFREHLNELLEEWRGAVQVAFERGQECGTVRPDVDPRAIATLIVSTFEGLAGTAKGTHDRSLTLSAGALFFDLLEGLRP